MHVTYRLIGILYWYLQIQSKHHVALAYNDINITNFPLTIPWNIPVIRQTVRLNRYRLQIKHVASCGNCTVSKCIINRYAQPWKFAPLKNFYQFYLQGHTWLICKHKSSSIREHRRFFSSYQLCLARKRRNQKEIVTESSSGSVEISWS